MDEQSNQQIDNMVQLKELNEASILHNLRIRYDADNIYTSVGSILVSVNPFKLLNIYTTEILQRYQDQGHRNLPPHVYGVADAAFSQMTANLKDQSCIVSGESGAGKTEATKIFLQFIAEVSSQAGKSGKEKEVTPEPGKKKNEAPTLQEQILKANPLMEAFGNAKTLRNNNSSRFGKWIEVKFNNLVGTITGGSIIQYLLEKSRIVSPAPGERNYHIFYNLCAGALMDPAVKDKFQIGEADDYHYLNQSDALVVEGINDERDWEDVLASMEVMGIGIEEQDDIIRTLAGILHLGNLVFEKGGNASQEDSKVANPDMLELAAAQFGVAADALEKALCQKDISNNRETMFKVNNMDQAQDARDALAKGIYSSMFEWLIQRINVSLKKNTGSGEKVSASNTSIIGVLDIFGFESFDWNSFEQLCINYCNEKLQFHFNNHIFQLEQDEYQAEGIDVSQIQFKDNQPTLDLFEKKPNGIFATIEEEMQVPKGSDGGFLKKITKKQENHDNFIKPGVKTNYERNSFSVIHYAGAVMYNVEGFLEKNRDSLVKDLNELVSSSKIPFVSNLFKSQGGGGGKGGKGGKSRGATRAGKKSLGGKFKAQLELLMTKLNKTEPHFIRCVKPNDEKAGGIFTSEMVLAQLRYAGLLEVCRIRQIGYPIRKDFRDFMFRYGVLIENPQKDAKKLCMALENKGLLPHSEYQVGKNKVFLRNAPFNDLEAGREVAVKKQAILLQRMGRGFVARQHYRRYKKLLADLDAAVKKREIEAIEQALIDCGDLPHQGIHLEQLKNARKVVERLEEERRVTKLIEGAIEKRDFNALKSSVQAAEQIKFDSPVVKKAKDLIEVIVLERKAIDDLKAAMGLRDLAAITTALKTVTSLGLGHKKEAQQAEVLRAKLEEEDRIIRNLQKSAEEKDLESLTEYLNAATDAGLENHEAVVAAKAVQEECLLQADEAKQAEIRAEEEKKKAEFKAKIDGIKEEIAAAVSAEDMDKLADLKSKAIEAGMNKDELDEALGEAEKMEENKEILNQIAAAMDTMKQFAASKGGINEAEVKALSDAVEGGRGAGLDGGIKEFQTACDFLEKMEHQLEIQKELQEAMDEGTFEALREALEAAGDLELDIDLVVEARDMMKDKGKDRPVSIRKQEEDAEEIDEDEFERRRKQNLLMAKNERFNFKKFYKIRSNGDYVKGIYFNKKKAAESKLVYQKTIIPKSLLNLKTKELNKMAIGINKSILGYCGEQPMQFPATLAQDILIKGLEQNELVDEVYIQLCKHLSNNRKPESVGRAWQLLCMAVGTFPPSGDFEHYLLNFLIEHISVPGLVGNYARYSLRRLEGMLIRGASGFVPTIDEILAYKERPPVLSTIELVDGTHLTEDLPIPPDLNVARVLEICTHFLNLEDSRKDSFGIFVQDDEDDEEEGELAASAYSAMRVPDPLDDDAPPPLPGGDDVAAVGPQPPPRTPRPLRSKDYIGDVVVQMTRQHRKTTFVFKRKIFKPNDDDKSSDPVYSRLMYLQAADEVISGNVTVEKEADLILLTAIAIAADSEEFPSKEEDLLEASLTEYIPLAWRNKKTDANWARAVISQRGKVIRKTNEHLESLYVSMVSKYPLWGQCFFYVRKEIEGSDMICGISNEGIHFYSLKRKEWQKYKYGELERWGGSSTQFWVLVNDKSRKKKVRVALYTSQARDMSNLILDYAKIAKSSA